MGPKSRFAAILAAGTAAAALLTGCNATFQKRGPEGGIVLGPGGVSTTSRDRSGNHSATSIDARNVCVSGGTTARENTKLCLPTGAVVDAIKGWTGGGTAPTGGTTPTPLATEGAASAPAATPAAAGKTGTTPRVQPQF